MKEEKIDYYKTGIENRVIMIHNRKNKAYNLHNQIHNNLWVNYLIIKILELS